jgi:hypothetical protein
MVARFLDVGLNQQPPNAAPKEVPLFSDVADEIGAPQFKSRS